MSEFSSRTLSSFYKNLSLPLLPNPLLEMFCQMDLSSSFIFIFSSWQILVPKSIKTQQPCCDLMLNKEDLLPDYPALKIESNIITMSPQLPCFKTKCTVCIWSIFLNKTYMNYIWWNDQDKKEKRMRNQDPFKISERKLLKCLFAFLAPDRESLINLSLVFWQLTCLGYNQYPCRRCHQRKSNNIRLSAASTTPSFNSFPVWCLVNQNTLTLYVLEP